MHLSAARAYGERMPSDIATEHAAPTRLRRRSDRMTTKTGTEQQTDEGNDDEHAG